MELVSALPVPIPNRWAPRKKPWFVELPLPGGRRRGADSVVRLPFLVIATALERAASLSTFSVRVALNSSPKRVPAALEG